MSLGYEPRQPRLAAAGSFAATVAVWLILAGCGGDDDGEQEPIPDLSGLAWLGGDRFLAVHDAKNPDELDSPRLSLLRLPESLAGSMRPMWMSNGRSPSGRATTSKAPIASRARTGGLGS